MMNKFERLESRIEKILLDITADCKDGEYPEGWQMWCALKKIDAARAIELGANRIMPGMLISDNDSEI